MRPDLEPGNPFPDLRAARPHRRAAQLSRSRPSTRSSLAFVRGWWCPKEQIRVRNLVAMQDELQREYGRIAVVTIDTPYVNGAFRAGLGADFPFLSDEDRAVAEELGIVELTDEKHRPFLPLTFVLDSRLVIRRRWNGFWFWGNPTPDELRTTLREITRDEQPSYDPISRLGRGRRRAARRRHRRAGGLDPRGLAGPRALARRVVGGRAAGGRRRGLRARRSTGAGGRSSRSSAPATASRSTCASRATRRTIGSSSSTASRCRRSGRSPSGRRPTRPLFHSGCASRSCCASITSGTRAAAGARRDRFRLLAFVPTIAGATVAILPQRAEPEDFAAVGLVGLAATLGVYLYELRNTRSF